MAADDPRDVAAEAARLALTIGSVGPESASSVAKLSKDFPQLAPVLKSLKGIRERLAVVTANGVSDAGNSDAFDSNAPSDRGTMRSYSCRVPEEKKTNEEGRSLSYRIMSSMKKSRGSLNGNTGVVKTTGKTKARRSESRTMMVMKREQLSALSQRCVYITACVIVAIKFRGRHLSGQNASGSSSNSGISMTRTKPGIAPKKFMLTTSSRSSSGSSDNGKSKDTMSTVSGSSSSRSSIGTGIGTGTSNTRNGARSFAGNAGRGSIGGKMIDVRPLEDCVDAVQKIVERCSKGGKLSMVLKATRVKNEISELNARVGDLAEDMGLAGIVAVFKGVLEEKGNSSQEDVFTKQEARLARQPQPVAQKADTPSRTPARPPWHVRRERVMSTVLKDLLRTDENNKPEVVGFVGGSGSGKTTAAAEIVRSDETREFFADGIVWLSVGSGDATARLPSLMCELAEMVRQDIVHGETGGREGKAGRGGGKDFTAVGRRSSAAIGAENDCEEYIQDVMSGSSIGRKQKERDRGRKGRRRALRCLVVADDVADWKVVHKLRDTGMWVLATTRDEEVIADAGGQSVRVDRLFETDAESVLRKASELPDGVPLPAAAKDLMELCGGVAMDLAFVGSWGAVRGNREPSVAWQDATESVRAELRDLERSRDPPDASSPVNDSRALQHKGILGTPFHVHEGAVGVIGDGSAMEWSDGTDPIQAEIGIGQALSSMGSTSSSCSSATFKDDARAVQRKAILRAGFRDLVVSTDDDRVRRLYIALAIMPDGHEFSSKDAAVLLYENGRECTHEDEETIRKVIKTLERWTTLTASGWGRGKDEKYRMHDAHASFARDILMNRRDLCQPVVKRWVALISSLNAMLSFEPTYLARLWSAVERVGGAGWRESRPYEDALDGVRNDDPLLATCVEAIAKFRNLEEDWKGASLMWRRLLKIEQKKTRDPNVMYPIWELVNAAEKRGKMKEAAAWRQYGYETLTLAMARMISPRDIRDDESDDNEGAGGIDRDTDGRTKGTAVVIRSLSLNMLRFGPSDGVEAELMLRRALEIEVASWGPDDTRVAVTMHRLGVCVRQLGRLREAEQLLRRALEMEKARLKPDDDLIARSIFHLGVCIRLAGRYEPAEELLRWSLEMETAKRGRDDVHVARTLYELGLCVRLAGRIHEAEQLLLRSLEIREAKLGPRDVSLSPTLHELGTCVQQNGGGQRRREAEVFFRRALSIKKAAIGSGQDVSIAHTLFQLGMCVLQTGRRLDEAEKLLRNVLAIEEARLGPEDASVARIMFHLGSCIRRAGRRDEAAEILRRALRTLEAKLGAGSEEVAQVDDMLAQCEATE